MATKLTLPRGNTLVINFAVSNTAGSTNILNGATIYFTVKSSPGYDNSTNDATAKWQIISTGNTGNTCTLTSTAENTWQEPNTYYWDITIAYSNGSVVTPNTGTINIVGIATNAAS